ncbi:MAG: hypothetical protein WBP26_05315 [Candidatus Saccharimonadales bacterium]
MSAEQRNFNNFELSGDNVYELAGGLIPEVADALEVRIGNVPNQDDMQAIMGAVGTNKVLRDNSEITGLSRDQMAGFVDRAGVQDFMARSFWTPDYRPESSDNNYLIVSGMANWQDRVVKLVNSERPGKLVYSLAGNRTMNTGTEQTNPQVQQMHATFKRYPKESEYAGRFVVPGLLAAGNDVLPTPFATGNADDMLEQFFAENPALLDERLIVARVANAGIIMAAQVREAARKFNPSYDADRVSPQLFVMTDWLPVARTAEDEANPTNYQKAQTALRQVVLTAKKIHEAQLQDR